MRENPNCLCDKTQREGGFKMMVMMVKNRIIKDRIYIIRGEEWPGGKSREQEEYQWNEREFKWFYNSTKV